MSNDKITIDESPADRPYVVGDKVRILARGYDNQLERTIVRVSERMVGIVVSEVEGEDTACDPPTSAFFFHEIERV